LLSNGQPSGVFTDPAPSSLPVGLTYIISYVSYTVCKITQVETGTVFIAGCQVSQDPQNIWMRIDWPADVPFQGVLSLFQPWAPGITVTITTSPSQFPYAAACNAILSQPYFSQLLLNFQLTSVVQNTLDPQDKLALILAVVALSNPNVYTQP
jgi:hypothetical protein